MKKTPVKKSSSTPFAQFCDRHEISYTALSDICGGSAAGAGRSTCERLCKDELSPQMAAKVRKLLAETLPGFLRSKGLSSSAIDSELLQIFPEGEYSPMIHEAAKLSLKVRIHFKLNKDPFAHPESRKESFISAGLQEILDECLEAIRGAQFVAVTGPIGSGKTIFRALLEDEVESRKNLQLIWPETFQMSKVTPASVARSIITSISSSTTVPVDSVARAGEVKSILAQQRGLKHVGIGFDECHLLSPVMLKSLKNFLEMCSSGGFKRDLGAVLLGQQTEFAMSMAKLPEVSQRLTILTMPTFQDSVEEFFAYRIKTAGGNLNALFDKEAIEFICREAETPLALGNIANAAFGYAFEMDEKKVPGSLLREKMTFEKKDAETKGQGKKRRYLSEV